MRQVAFLMEGARTMITHHQMFLFAPTDAALIIVFLILLTRTRRFCTVTIHAEQGGR